MNILTLILTGIVFLASAAFVTIALWMGFTHYPTIMLSLVAVITVIRAYQVHIERPSREFRVKWFIFWFYNEWLKLVLLLIAAWLIIKYFL
ncbi:hypothetical protein LCGC14_1852170 [marine sediment metagenome]|uniref:Uncharacterized protein n=1 Tax=marine sediment metagenome TaxID=412755 RepID=A0A0F9IPK3_9ZZZZ